MPATPDHTLATRDTVRLPIKRPVRRPARRAPLALAAVVTTVWAALVSLAPIVVVVALANMIDTSGAAAGRVARLGLAAWLLAHGVPVETRLGAISLAPLALSILAMWRVSRAGVHSARAIGARGGPHASPRRRLARSARAALATGTAVGVVYGVLGVLAAVGAKLPGVHVSVVRAGLTLAAFGAIVSVLGAAYEARVLAHLVARTPAIVRDSLRTGLVAALLVLAAGAVLAGTAVAIAGGEASDILHDYHTGVAGQAGLTLVCLLYTPNAAVWATSYLVGPGFAIGTGTSVSVAKVDLGPLPTVPLLAGLPSGPVSSWGSLLLGVPVAAGLLAGWLLGRRRLRGTAPGLAPGWADLLGAAALAGPVAGCLLGFAAEVSSGSLGSGRLTEIGPHVFLVGAVAAMVVAAGATLAAAATKAVLSARRN
jgi:Family of unknown function (DUF6350)